jgi:iron complex outermembrane receptor protein
MFSRVGILILTSLLSATTALAGEPVTIGVMDFVGKKGVPQETAEVIGDIIAQEISNLGDVRVINKADIVSMLNLEKQRRLAGCSDSQCFSEIAGALGMSWMVTGNVSLFVETYVLNLKLIDVRNVIVVGRVTRRVKGSEEDLLYEIPEATEELFERVSDRLGLAVERRVTVSSRRIQPISQSPSAVWVITREDIEASGASDIANILRMVPGMDVVLSTPLNVSVSARLEWNDENQHFLVLIDGREVNLEALGQAPLQIQPISLDDIERIEIIRGPASSLYGANALAGVISITTRAISEGTSGWAEIAGGEVGSIIAGARASTRFGSWGVSLSGGADISGTFVDPRELGKEVVKLRSVAEYRWSDNRRLLIDAGYSRSEGALSSSLGKFDSESELLMARMAYESADIRGNLYWTYVPVAVQLDAPLDFAGIRLATFLPAEAGVHTVNGEIQWTLPQFYEPLVMIAGAMGRSTWIDSDQLLGAETYADITSPRYHQPGLHHWEGRGGAFVHLEYSPFDWIRAFGDLRFDYNTVTEEFISPKLAAIVRPAPGQFVRLGAARAFRKPSIMETHFHMNVDFPDDSPITGDDRENFREFMLRGIGNSRLDNEELISLEVGYLGQFLENRLNVSLDIYYNFYTDRIGIEDAIIRTSQGLPDLEQSSFLFVNKKYNDLRILGSELAVRFTPSSNLSLVAAWAHREVLPKAGSKDAGRSPRNLITLGARFNTDSGLVGSFYAFSRSKFTAGGVPNPAGPLVKPLTANMDNVLLILGKFGWRVRLPRGIALETGLKLFLPVSPFTPPYFSYNEVGGVTTSTGQLVGGDLLSRMVSVYLQGSFCELGVR